MLYTYVHNITIISVNESETCMKPIVVYVINTNNVLINLYVLYINYKSVIIRTYIHTYIHCCYGFKDKVFSIYTLSHQC